MNTNPAYSPVYDAGSELVRAVKHALIIGHEDELEERDIFNWIPSVISKRLYRDQSASYWNYRDGLEAGIRLTGSKLRLAGVAVYFDDKKVDAWFFDVTNQPESYYADLIRSRVTRKPKSVLDSIKWAIEMLEKVKVDLNAAADRSVLANMALNQYQGDWRYRSLYYDLTNPDLTDEAWRLALNMYKTYGVISDAGGAEFDILRGYLSVSSAT